MWCPAPNLTLCVLLARTQGASLEQRLKQHSMYIPNHDTNNNLDSSVLYYTDQKLRFLRGKQVFWNMIYFSHEDVRNTFQLIILCQTIKKSSPKRTCQMLRTLHQILGLTVTIGQDRWWQQGIQPAPDESLHQGHSFTYSQHAVNHTFFLASFHHCFPNKAT